MNSPTEEHEYKDRLVRCHNWKDPKACHPECTIEYPVVAQKKVPWQRWVQMHGWITLESGEMVEGKPKWHTRPFCTLGCMQSWINEVARQKDQLDAEVERLMHDVLGPIADAIAEIEREEEQMWKDKEN